MFYIIHSLFPNMCAKVINVVGLFLSVRKVATLLDAGQRCFAPINGEVD